MVSAYLLVSHGSRDPRPQVAVERLAYLVRQQLSNQQIPVHLDAIYQHYPNQINRKVPGSTDVLSLREYATGVSAGKMSGQTRSPLVGTAALELAPVKLHESIQQFGLRARGLGWKRLQILPLFLLPGVHVREDIPTEVALAQKNLEAAIRLEIGSYLGSYPSLINLLHQQFAQLPAEGRILLAHGSRRPGANQPIAAIAAQLNALPAYWSVSPSLAQQVEALANAGKQTLTLLPYFLFTGGITEAIATQVQKLQQTFPHLKLQLGQPLGATPELANLIVKGIGR